MMFYFRDEAGDEKIVEGVDGIVDALRLIAGYGDENINKLFMLASKGLSEDMPKEAVEMFNQFATWRIVAAYKMVEKIY